MLPEKVIMNELREYSKHKQSLTIRLYLVALPELQEESKQLDLFGSEGGEEEC